MIRGEIHDTEIRQFFYSIEFLEQTSGIESNYASMIPPIYNSKSWKLDSVNYTNWINNNGCKLSKEALDSIIIELNKEWLSYRLQNKTK
jgi:hypothetical protein